LGFAITGAVYVHQGNDELAIAFSSLAGTAILFDIAFLSVPRFRTISRAVDNYNISVMGIPLTGGACP